ncbi:Protein strictosidine synthase-like 10 [Vitis vinifera]|uniref:Protein strictosidine synthase-like 10 n=1 Tax=Vitis vinifera TaxID=29760 RepID=A0A438C1K7_VITVI|nr:Protein strictosidine synthase-like 10 [Vitis vinifera]
MKNTWSVAALPTFSALNTHNGLNVVGPKDGRIIQLATAAEGVPFLFLNAVDVDQETGIVYFTDASARFQRREFMLAVQTGDMTGRLMKYDPRTQEVTVLLRGLGGAGGVTISKDGSFILARQITLRAMQEESFGVAVNIGAGTAVVPLGLRLSEEGKVLQMVAFGTGDIPKTISESSGI